MRWGRTRYIDHSEYVPADRRTSQWSLSLAIGWTQFLPFPSSFTGFSLSLSLSLSVLLPCTGLFMASLRSVQMTHGTRRISFEFIPVLIKWTAHDSIVFEAFLSTWTFFCRFYWIFWLNLIHSRLISFARERISLFHCGRLLHIFF